MPTHAPKFALVGPEPPDMPPNHDDPYATDGVTWRHALVEDAWQIGELAALLHQDVDSYRPYFVKVCRAFGPNIPHPEETAERLLEIARRPWEPIFGAGEMFRRDLARLYRGGAPKWRISDLAEEYRAHLTDAHMRVHWRWVRDHVAAPPPRPIRGRSRRR